MVSKGIAKWCVRCLALVVLGVWPLGCGDKASKAELSQLERSLEANPQDVQSRAALADSLLDKGEYERATEIADAGLALKPDDPAFLKLLSKIHANWGAHEGEKSGHFALAEGYIQRLFDSGAADSEVYGRLGVLQSQKGLGEEAVKSLTKALELDPNNVRVLGELGSEYNAQGKYEKALPLLEKAVQGSGETLDSSGDLIWCSLGDTQRLLGDYDASLASMEKGYEVASGAKRERHQKCVEYSRLLASKEKGWPASRQHRDFAVRHRHWETRRNDRAMAEYQRALELLPDGNDDEVIRFRGLLYSDIGAVYNSMNEPEKGRDSLLQAIEVLKPTKHFHELAAVYDTLGRTYRQIIKREKLRLDNIDPNWEKEMRNRIRAAEMETVRCHQAAGEKKEADETLQWLALDSGWGSPEFKQARQEIARTIPPEGDVMDPSDVWALHNEALYLKSDNDYEGALTLLLRAQKYYDTRGKETQGTDAVEYYLDVARMMMQARGDKERYVEFCQKALEVANAIRSRIGTDAYKRSAATKPFMQACYKLVQEYTERKDGENALYYTEQFKSRTLLDLLGSQSVEVRKKAVEKCQTEQRTALAKLDDLKQQVTQAQTRNDADTVRSLERDLSIEQTHYQRLAEDNGVAKLELANLDSIEVPRWQDLKASLKGFTFVDYMITISTTSMAVIINEDGVHPIVLEGLEGRQVHALVEAFRKEIVTSQQAGRDLSVVPDNAAKASTPPAANTPGEAGRKLYDLLIKPVLPYLNTELVYFSPSDELSYIPFEALQDEAGRYFIEDHAVAYAPSASVLKLCLDKNRHSKESLLALGNPNLMNPQFRLAHAEEEVKGLEGLFAKSTVLTFDGATETALKQLARDCDIVHLACHGELNRDDPMLSSLRLTPDTQNDGYLHAGEVFDLNLKASLVVLSACNTGLGELSTGNELAGLTRSFLYAGAPAIMASLWTVDDRSTAYLMEQFYKNLGTMNKAQALRKAKLATMKQYAAPFYWAAFCLQGDYQ